MTAYYNHSKNNVRFLQVSSPILRKMYSEKRNLENKIFHLAQKKLNLL